MIEKLTKSQETKLAEYKDKWIKIGLNSKTGTLEEIHTAIEKVYAIAKLKKPIIILLDSPVSCLMAYLIFNSLNQIGDKTKIMEQVREVREQVWEQVRNKVGEQVRDKVLEQIMEQVREVRDKVLEQVRNKVGEQVWGQVWEQIMEQVREVREQVRGQVRNKVGEQVRDQVRGQVRDQVRNFIFGNHDASWLNFYDFFLNEVGLTCCEKLTPLIKVAELTNWILPYENVCFVSKKPTIKMKDRILHCEDGPAILYPDGFAVYALNGVRVMKEIVYMKPEKITKEMILKEKNVEIRREIIRKIGIERLIKITNAKIIDEWNEYQLLNIDFDNTYRPYLKMKNPSIGTWHVEGVHPNCKTVKDALKWRNGISGQPIKLT